MNFSKFNFSSSLNIVWSILDMNLFYRFMTAEATNFSKTWNNRSQLKPNKSSWQKVIGTRNSLQHQPWNICTFPFPCDIVILCPRMPWVEFKTYVVTRRNYRKKENFALKELNFYLSIIKITNCQPLIHMFLAKWNWQSETAKRSRFYCVCHLNKSVFLWRTLGFIPH